MPAYSCGTNPAYNNNNAINLMPVGDRKDEASWFNPKDVLNNMAAPVSGTVPIQYSNSGISNGHVEQFQGPTPMDSLFCNQDPR
ncbi:UNVERIFIED_CONTAM: hypothetical protein Sradi_0211300 [Sesamum radiatum]|uniref:Uncharacterized protein n=1 Tax=Sesamum radiatum TaxID=300843 RepID=A0AAW2VZF2_SESRA